MKEKEKKIIDNLSLLDKVYKFNKSNARVTIKDIQSIELNWADHDSYNSIGYIHLCDGNSIAMAIGNNIGSSVESDVAYFLDIDDLYEYARNFANEEIQKFTKIYNMFLKV
jgi:hypothetical protein